jgi:hypothetical protein
MPPNRLRNNEVDLLNSPGELALKRMGEQVDWAVDQLKKPGINPVTRWLHQHGIKRKDLENF